MKFRNLTLGQQFLNGYTGNVNYNGKKLVDEWSIKSTVYDGVLENKVCSVAEYLREVRQNLGLTLLFDERIVINCGGRRNWRQFGNG